MIAVIQGLFYVSCSANEEVHQKPKKLGAQLGQVTLAKRPKGCSRPENIMQADVGLGMGSGIGQ